MLLANNIMASNQDFETVLNRYRANLVEYKLTGNSAFKALLETDRAWLDSYIQIMRNQTQEQQNYIQNFVTQYQNTNPELVEMQERIQNVRKEGPMLDDTYQTELEAQAQEPLDFSPYYVKAGLIAGVFGLLVAMSFF